MYKITNAIETYLLLDINRYIRNALTKFRCGMSNIAFHAKRYKAASEHDLQCRLCFNGYENEVHFLLCCPELHDIRVRYIHRRYYTHPCTFKLVLLLANNNRQTIKDLAIYLFFAFKRLKSVSDV